MALGELRSLVEDAITSRINAYEWEELKEIEREERSTLASTIAGFTGSENGQDDLRF
jgi:hypothetical protein